MRDMAIRALVSEFEDTVSVLAACRPAGVVICPAVRPYLQSAIARFDLIVFENDKLGMLDWRFLDESGCPIQATE